MRQFGFLATLVLSACNVFATHSPDLLFVKLRAPVQYSSLDGSLYTASSTVNDLLDDGATASVPFANYSHLSHPLERIVLISLRSNEEIAETVDLLSSDIEIEWTALNNHYQVVHSLDDPFVPRDSLYGEAWWLHKIEAELAWEITRGDSNVIIGIIDTGVDYIHRDLRENIWHNRGEIADNGVDDDNNGFIDDTIGWDFVDAPSLPAGGDYLDRDNDPMDEMGHGTYVSGCAAATSDNPDCFPSIGFSCRIMPLRAGNANGTLEEDDVAAAILYGAANGASIINMSFGDVVASPLLREVISIAHEAGVVLVASAGNANNNGIHYPSGFPEVIGVGATDRFDRRASFSNLGPSVEIMAPGVDILSTILGGTCGEWVFTSGTSYAAPIVAGVAGLMISVNPSLSSDDILDLLRSTAEDIGIEGWDSSTVNGRVNARRAVERAQFGADAVARISLPRTDTGVRGTIAIIGDAKGTAFSDFTIDAGYGENPRTWQRVTSSSSRVSNDTLAILNAPNTDTVLVVRLTVRATTGSQSVDMAHLYVQNAPPVIDSVVSRTVLDGPGYGQQVIAWSNQFSRATLLMTNSAGDSVREDFGYVGKDHVAVISQSRYTGEWQAVLQVTNLIGEFARTAPFAYNSTENSIRPYFFNSRDTNLPHGIVCSQVSDYDCDGFLEIWLLPVDNLNTVDTLESFEWNGTQFVETENTYGPHIPQVIGDADGDGKIELAARRGIESRIWEQTDSCSILNNLVFQSPDFYTEFVISKYVVIDSTSGRSDILARTNIGNSSRMALFRVSSDFSLTIRDTLANISTGLNSMGPPGSAVGDFDSDGRLDVVYGDYDGDIIWNEWTGSEMLPVWTTRLRQNDATAWLEAGDLNCDGVPELIAGCRSNTGPSSESQRLLSGWDYYVFAANGDNSLIAVDSVAILGNENVSFNPASVKCADVYSDGCDDLLISSYPDYYIFYWNDSSGGLEVKWYSFPSEAGAMTVADIDGNGLPEILASNGDVQVRIEDAVTQSNAPFPPVLSGIPQDETTLHLEWTAVPGAVHYEVYASEGNAPYELISVTTSTSFDWTAADIDIEYQVAVATYDTSFAQPISVYSNVLRLTPNHPPTVQDTAVQVSPSVVFVQFSEQMGASVFVQGNWRLLDGTMPSVISGSEGARRVYLSFDTPFEPGQYTLQLGRISDIQGTPLPEAEKRVSFTIENIDVARPYVVAHSLVDAPVGREVEIVFSEPLEVDSVLPSKFRIIDPRRDNVPYNAQTVQSVTSDGLRFRVRLDERYPVGAVGHRVYIEIAPIASTRGGYLEETTIQISQSAQDLDNAYVYPNPFKGSGAFGSTGVFFAALPVDASIRIYSLQGKLIRKLEHKSASGHEEWDLLTEDGQTVASGIYLYRIEANGQEKLGKLAVIR
ncbi:S8 family serine peptidase [bacterium]|nr:S8 family serine peptidase [bacterium]